MDELILSLISCVFNQNHNTKFLMDDDLLINEVS